MQRLLFNRLLVITHDLLLIPLAWFGAYWLRFNLESIPSEFVHQSFQFFNYALFAQGLSYFFIGSYRSMWGFASMHDLVKIIKAVVLGGLFLLISLYFSSVSQTLPRSIIPLYMILLVASLSTSRLAMRWLRDLIIRQQHASAERVLIVGAGTAAEGLIRDMLRRNIYRPLALVDDQNSKQGQEIHGIPVKGTTHDIPLIVKSMGIESIILAIPSAKSSEVRDIMQICESTGLVVHTLPTLQQVVAGQVTVDLLRKVSLEDLLGRDPVNLDWHSIQKSINSQTVLVTGAGGSIGSELCRQICKLNPKELIAIDSCEFNLFTLEQELENDFPNLILHKYLVDIRDQIAIERLFAQHLPQVVFHAAAYKHVPLLQHQIRAAMSNNILGTHIVATAAKRYAADKFVLISTDKAVNPCNIMGASKRAAEVICQSLHGQSKTAFITVRFGNVLGSAGSVVPTFKQQIERGGPVTVTHPEITRYFMTIPEATQLILQAMTISTGGEIFVLDMGEPVKIKSLAEHMIKLAGKRPGSDIEIIYSGLRPGEKLYEELFYEQEELSKTDHAKILRAYPHQITWDTLAPILQKADLACKQHENNLMNEILNELVPELAVAEV